MNPSISNAHENLPTGALTRLDSASLVSRHRTAHQLASTKLQKLLDRGELSDLIFSSSQHFNIGPKSCGGLLMLADMICGQRVNDQQLYDLYVFAYALDFHVRAIDLFEDSPLKASHRLFHGSTLMLLDSVSSSSISEALKENEFLQLLVSSSIAQRIGSGNAHSFHKNDYQIYLFSIFCKVSGLENRSTPFLRDLFSVVQLIDDFIDVLEDQENGSKTIFTEASNESFLKILISSLSKISDSIKQHDEYRFVEREFELMYQKISMISTSDAYEKQRKNVIDIVPDIFNYQP